MKNIKNQIMESKDEAEPIELNLMELYGQLFHKLEKE